MVCATPIAVMGSVTIVKSPHYGNGVCISLGSAVDSGGAGGAIAPPEFGGSEKGRSLISAYWSLAISTNTPGFKKLSMALNSTTKLKYVCK